jgi:hypothetical protein
LKTLSSRARSDLIQRAKLIAPKTPFQLWLYVAAYFKFRVPWQWCCVGHDTPFDMLWSLWIGKPSSFIAIGARDSYKTLTLAASETLDIIHKGCGVVHIGAIESQALKCYSYVKKNLSMFEDLFAKPPLMSRTDLNNGGHLEIIPCTINRVNSPHEPKVRFDEVELADPVSYNEAKFIAASDERGNEASICYTTTRKFAYGLAQQEVEAAVRAGRRVYIWCYKDVAERCTDERSGTHDVSIWINRLTLQVSRRPAKDMQEYIVKDKCLDCKLVASCRGDLKNSNGIKSIDDLILKMENSSVDYWLSQMECLRPSRKGLMIYNFNPDINAVRIDWNMFLTPSGEFNRERFIYAWGKDWGWNPDATVLCMIDKHRDCIYVIKEFSIKGKIVEQVALELHEFCRRTPFGYPEDIQCDKSEPGLIATLQGAGFAMASAVEESDIEGGCNLLNYLSQPPTSAPMLYVDRVNCPMLIWELTVGYIRATDPRSNEPGDAPRDKNNHFIDALRYVVWRYLRKYMVASGCYTNIGDAGSRDEIRKEIRAVSGIDDRGVFGDDELASLAYLLLKSDD